MVLAFDPGLVEVRDAVAEEGVLKVLGGRQLRVAAHGEDHLHGVERRFIQVVLEGVRAVGVEDLLDVPEELRALGGHDLEEVLEGLDLAGHEVLLQVAHVVVVHDVVLVLEVPVESRAADAGFVDDHLDGDLVKVVLLDECVERIQDGFLGAIFHVRPLGHNDNLFFRKTLSIFYSFVE